MGKAGRGLQPGYGVRRVGWEALAPSLHAQPSHAAEKAALKSGKPGRYLRRRLSAVFKRFGVEAWFRLERSFVSNATERARRHGKGLPPCERLHIHGELLLPSAALAAIEAAILGAIGRWEGFAKARQIKLRPGPDQGWAWYTLSDVREDDEPFFTTAGLPAMAKELYEHWRKHRNPIRKNIFKRRKDAKEQARLNRLAGKQAARASQSEQSN